MVWSIVPGKSKDSTVKILGLNPGFATANWVAFITYFTYLSPGPSSKKETEECLFHSFFFFFSLDSYISCNVFRTVLGT